MKLSDTLTGTTTEFQPGNGEVRMYVCGITPYSDAHLGHAMSYIVFDVLRRYLEYAGHTVRHIQNFTDVDDRIIQRAAERGETTEVLAGRYMDEFLEDMASLNVTPAHVYPRATQEIDEMVRIIGVLIEKGFAYAIPSGDVYYRVRRKADYGKLSHRDIDQLLSGARIEPDEAKEDPLDFALWKGVKPGEPSWDSPWGKGRPGWHIECTAMSLRYLGEDRPIDIHAGGHDLIFPHHENEIAQSEAYNGREPFARYWLHNGWLQLGGEKMSKSLGNIITIRDGVARYGPDGIRAFVLGSHYRKPLTYSDAIIDAAARGIDRLRAAVHLSQPSLSDSRTIELSGFRARFIEAMDDDLNTPGAISVLHDLAREINRGHTERVDITAAQSILRELADVLGLVLEPVQTDGALAAAPFIELLVQLRSELRTDRQYQLADKVRDGLAALGVTLDDSPEGTAWRAPTRE